MPYVKKRMPARKPFRKSTKPRKTTRFGKPSSRRTTYSRGPFSSYNRADPFRPSYFARLHYTYTSTLTTNATTSEFGAEDIFRLNSVYDPNFSGTVSSQPYGFSTMAQLYRRYKVSGVLINFVFTDPTSDGIVVAATLQPPQNVFTLQGAGPDEVREQPMSITRSINNSGKQVVSIKQYMPMHTLLGVTKSQFHNDLDIYSALVTADPSLTPLMRVAAATIRPGSQQSVICRVTLTYYTQFYNRKEIV